MDDACYLCRRTQVDLDRLNEEIRTRVYLSYFTNTRGQIDEGRRRVNFLQRLKDEESGDPHFRINAKQVFGDPKAYEKLMPWIDTLIEIARSGSRSFDDSRSIGELVDLLLQEERHAVASLEEGLNNLRTGFATSGKFPYFLETVKLSFPVEWSLGAQWVSWRPSQPGDREPLQRVPGESKPLVETTVHLCSVCRKFLQRP